MALVNKGDSQQFNYIGSVQTVTLTESGLYKLEVYGGKGALSSSKAGYSGNGGYSVGYIQLEAGTTLYVVCGGGTNKTKYNGGGSAVDGTYAGHGGGATHIALMTGTLAQIGVSNLDKILIVAGGGGGQGETNGSTYKRGGAGGGSNGANGSGGTYYGYGASQTQGGQGYANYSTPAEVTKGKFGQGGSDNCPTGQGNFYAGGGGGGLYGGGAGGWSTSGNANGSGGGGGGSGYIGGVPTIDFYGTTYSPSTQQGVNTGNGYAIITLQDILPPEFNITLDYNAELGSASYTYGSYTADQIDLNLSATANQNAYFIGWYVNSQLISDNPTYVYTVTGDVTIEARFGITYIIRTEVNGNGSIDYTRFGTGNNDVTFNVIPNANHHFVKYTITNDITSEKTFVADNDDIITTESGDSFTLLTAGVNEVTTTPYTVTLTNDVYVTAYFEENSIYTINTTSNVENASVYVSENPVYDGTIVTLFARPIADYYFVQWEDGVIDNPREITVTSDITMVAVYHRIQDRQNIYPYRCYIKDQLNLTDPPKAFLRVDNFNVKTDLLTNANSTINVLDTSSNINNGDILVLYDETGQTLYQGVIKSIEDMSIQCSQMQSFYKGNWIYNVHPSASLEEEIAYLLGQYAQGKMYGSSWTDPLVAQRLGGITIQYESSTSANLPTDTDDNNNDNYSIQDMEKFIYSLYEDYGIVFRFEINFSGANYVTIKVPDFQTLKVGNNMYAIKDMSPIQTIEETNRLIIYSKNKTYRTTYVATGNGIVEAPSTTAGRFNITNTKIVFSDDNASDLVSANLPSQMYNHKLTFTLIVKNFIYEFGDFNLGGTLDVWHGDDYYNTVLTGYEIKKTTNQNITEVNFTCGLVRTALTKLLTLGRVS